MAQKVLRLDPDDPIALIAASEVIAERTRDTDLDKAQRYDQARKYALHALETIDTDIPIPTNAPQTQLEKIDAYKKLLRSSAYSVLGTIDYGQEKYADAQGYFQKSIDAYPSQPDPVVVLRLALALDKQGKYGDALKEANQAVDLTQEGTAAGTTARHERDRLVQLTGGIPVSGSPAPPSNPPAGSAPNTTPH
jgi:tetratricopeptide (TPR) repeat protein